VRSRGDCSRSFHQTPALCRPPRRHVSAGSQATPWPDRCRRDRDEPAPTGHAGRGRQNPHAIEPIGAGLRTTGRDGMADGIEGHLTPCDRIIERAMKHPMNVPDRLRRQPTARRRRCPTVAEPAHRHASCIKAGSTADSVKAHVEALHVCQVSIARHRLVDIVADMVMAVRDERRGRTSARSTSGAGRHLRNALTCRVACVPALIASERFVSVVGGSGGWRPCSAWPSCRARVTLRDRASRSGRATAL
jgi:hypothetical protein